MAEDKKKENKETETEKNLKEIGVEIVKELLSPRPGPSKGDRLTKNHNGDRLRKNHNGKRRKGRCV